MDTRNKPDSEGEIIIHDNKRQRGGARSKLTKNVINEICKSVSIGLTYEMAAARAGVTYRTYHNWETRARAGEGGLYADLNQKLKEANAKMVLKNVAIIQNAAQGEKIVKKDKNGTESTIWKNRDWKASAWLLENNFPDLFGKRAITETKSAKLIKTLEDGSVLEKEVSVTKEDIEPEINISSKEEFINYLSSINE